MLRHGGSQPRKQEGASHVSAARQERRGVPDEFFSSFAPAESFFPVLFLYFRQHLVELPLFLFLVLFHIFLLPGFCFFFYPYFRVSGNFFRLFFFFPGKFYSLSFFFPGKFYSLSFFFPAFFLSLFFLISVPFFSPSFFFPAHLFGLFFFRPAKEIQLRVRAVVDPGASYADEAEYLPCSKESVRTGEK